MHDGNTNDKLSKIIDMMRELERYLAILYGIAASSTNEPFISAIMRKISIESAMHNYILTTIKELIRECPPKKVFDMETLASLQGSIEEAITHTKSLIDYINSMEKVHYDTTNVIIDKLNELEDYEDNAVRVYSFLLRSYLPITSTRMDARHRAASKLIVKLLKGISDDEKHHSELLQVIREYSLKR
ncbi:hypothetical protein [Vulcanisaeta distributa]|uniref:Rubrerythrin diiron-binding domain-containing protein n=1 Tax=Vulcanisaeta distributa (strain DSM 14429 / JCM 11212 / NBRC 100878 / IC-017) TaxID=572478 RepID=E1QRZ1_VULDI|nr:hypothetical protein [Vulcanisaeta distributa]ADN50708.1 hypothetical protein Vdis_1322 [Vulcanisaeta distributa DSM 14429]